MTLYMIKNIDYVIIADMRFPFTHDKYYESEYKCLKNVKSNFGICTNNHYYAFSSLFIELHSEFRFKIGLSNEHDKIVYRISINIGNREDSYYTSSICYYNAYGQMLLALNIKIDCSYFTLQESMQYIVDNLNEFT